MEKRETRYSDSEICFAKIKKQKQEVVCAFVYDPSLEKVCGPETLFSGKPKYLNINPGRDDKKYIYMDSELHFLGKLIDDRGFKDAIIFLKKYMPEEVFDNVFQNIIVPSLGGGVAISEFVRANRKLVRQQLDIAKKNKAIEDAKSF